jgi:hypothetical protein
MPAQTGNCGEKASLPLFLKKNIRAGAMEIVLIAGVRREANAIE